LYAAGLLSVGNFYEMKEQQKKDQKKKKPAETAMDGFQPKGPRDGLDNTGTQGYDSLKDDGYTGSTDKEAGKGTQDGTGSSSEDFPELHQ